MARKVTFTLPEETLTGDIPELDGEVLEVKATGSLGAKIAQVLTRSWPEELTGVAPDPVEETPEESVEAPADEEPLAVRQAETFSVPAAADLPLAARDRAWDASAAEGRVRAWADAEDGPNAQYAQAFFWQDGDGENFGDFRLGFADVIDGELHAMPRGIFAVAAVCMGARGGVDLTDAELAQVKDAVGGYYARMMDEFDDPEMMPPWEQEAAETEDLAAGPCIDCGASEDGTQATGGTADASPEALKADAETLAEEGEEAALEDADLPEIDPANPGRFKAVLAVEGERTADSRLIEVGAVTWRTPPLALMLMTKTDIGHDGAEIAGVIESIYREGNLIVGEGRFDASETGVEAARLVAHRVLTGVSVDGGDVEVEYDVEEEDEYGNPTAVLARIVKLTILGSTIVPFPAIASATIDWLAPDGEPVGEMPPLVAAAPKVYPAAAFGDPSLRAPTAIQVTPDGRVFGHAALWGTCHIGIEGVCVTAPRGGSYDYFRTGAVNLDDETVQPVGTITLDANHATNDAAAADASAHYDHTGRAAAFVNCGEDEHGIWIAGVLAPGVSDEDATRLFASSLSGDWRRIGGRMELVAVLAVNVPGFPVARSRNGEPWSLVAAGYGAQKRTKALLAAEVDALSAEQDRRFGEMEARLRHAEEQVERLTGLLAPIVKERLAVRFNR